MVAKYRERANLFEAKKHSTNVILGERDWRIMRLLFENKIVSRDQIHEQFFPDATKNIVNRRLRQITSIDFIKRKSIAVGRKIIYGYSLTQHGLAKVKPTLPYEVKSVRSSSECPLHDIALNDIREVFKTKASVKSYYTENVLQTCDDYQDNERFQPFIELNSDAMAEVNSKVGVLNLAIEFDTTCKSKSRYVKKINAYYEHQEVDGVLYICVNDYILNALIKVDKEVSERHECDPKLYFALLEDVTCATGEITFTNADEYIFIVS